MLIRICRESPQNFNSLRPRLVKSPLRLMPLVLTRTWAPTSSTSLLNRAVDLGDAPVALVALAPRLRLPWRLLLRAANKALETSTSFVTTPSSSSCARLSSNNRRCSSLFSPS